MVFYIVLRFSALSAKYKDFHLADYLDEELEASSDRFQPTAKRITEGWLTYSLLELKQRYNIPGLIFLAFGIHSLLVYTGPLYPVIDESLNAYNDTIQVEFSKRWSRHKCNVPGCTTVLVFDGGCKVLVNAYWNGRLMLRL